MVTNEEELKEGVPVSETTTTTTTTTYLPKCRKCKVWPLTPDGRCSGCGQWPAYCDVEKCRQV